MKTILIFGFASILALYSIIFGNNNSVPTTASQTLNIAKGPAFDPEIKVCCQKIPGRFRLSGSQKNNRVTEDMGGIRTLQASDEAYTYILKRPECSADIFTQFLTTTTP